MIDVCPIFCNGHGQYLQGSCHCESGWKGRECTLRSNECEIADCNGNGLCIDGSCHCRPGFKGNDCEQGIYLAKYNDRLGQNYNCALI